MFQNTAPSVLRCPSPRLARRAAAAGVSLLVGAGVLGLLRPSEAYAQIKHPGAHPKYSVELEPHLLIQWNDKPFWSDEGFGPGMRVNIPFLDNGPVRTINNNMAIGVGLDVAFFDCDNNRYWDRYRVVGDDCSATDWWIPVVAQWNFFLTPVISVFGEAGLAIEYEHWSWEYPCATGVCDDSDGDLDPVEPLFWGGGRFLLGDTVSFIARLGTPYISVGVGILL